MVDSLYKFYFYCSIISSTLSIGSEIVSVDSSTSIFRSLVIIILIGFLLTFILRLRFQTYH
jgi:hypothetical protein